MHVIAGACLFVSHDSSLPIDFVRFCLIARDEKDPGSIDEANASGESASEPRWSNTSRSSRIFPTVGIGFYQRYCSGPYQQYCHFPGCVAGLAAYAVQVVLSAETFSSVSAKNNRIVRLYLTRAIVVSQNLVCCCIEHVACESKVDSCLRPSGM
jgi:hypothetical protein